MVKDYRQGSLHEVGSTGRAGLRVKQDKAQRRQAMVTGIYLSAAMMVLFGIGLLTTRQAFIPAADAHGVALLCFAVAVVDLVLVQYFKWTWRKRDGH